MDDRFLQKLLHFLTFGDYAGRNSKGSPWLFRKDFMNTDRERSILKILVHDKKATVKEAEDYIRLHMMERSKKAYLLCNSSKFSTRCFHHLCHASELSGIISEGEVSEGLGEYFL